MRATGKQVSKLSYTTLCIDYEYLPFQNSSCGLRHAMTGRETVTVGGTGPWKTEAFSRAMEAGGNGLPCLG